MNGSKPNSPARIGSTTSRGHSCCTVWRWLSHPGPLPWGEYVFSVIAARANGARTLVRRKVGWRRGLETSQRGSAVPTILRDKSRAPGQFLVGALHRYWGERESFSRRSAIRTFRLSPRGARCSLSLRERVRVTGNGANDPRGSRTVPGTVELDESSAETGGFPK